MGVNEIRSRSAAHTSERLIITEIEVFFHKSINGISHCFAPFSK